MESIVVLLTGTIKVSNVPFLLMTDTAQREREYYKSIQKWMSLGYPVIFCENSNYHSEMINELVKDITPQKFEYLKFTTTVSHLGKGNGEAEILDYVFKHSKLIHNHTIICKSTGKNFVSNAKQICHKVLTSPTSQSIVTAIFVRNLTMADSRFFFFKKDFYFKYWAKYINDIDEHHRIYLEHTLAKSIHLAIAAGEKWILLPALPVVEGYLGTYATLYRNGFFKTRMNNLFYYIMRKWIAGKGW